MFLQPNASHLRLTGCPGGQRSALGGRLQTSRLQNRHTVHQNCKGRSRYPLQVQAGLNYPHMPNRMRRQIQEVKYTALLYISRAAQYLATLPGIKQVLQAWRALHAQLKPYLMRLNEFRENTKEAYLKKVDAYDEFCLEELKRKYKWRAYARRDEELLVGFLKLAFYRVSVIVCIAEWQFLAPTALMWTLIFPLFMGRAFIEKGDPIWWWYVATMGLFIILKHPIGLPPRWI